MAFLFQLDKRLLGIGLRLVLGTAPLKIIQLGIQIFLVAHLIYDVDFGVDPFIFTEKALGQLPLITCNLASQSQTLLKVRSFSVWICASCARRSKSKASICKRNDSRVSSSLATTSPALTG